ncbi:hypothetical protein HZB60_04070 [candidate division KSB1 bacterium]|nr:hypothetical protein [candidate division KSB1 bacterium]
MQNGDIAKAIREEARWRILATVNLNRPQSTNETTILRVLTDVQLNLSPMELRKELDYLEERGLVEVGGKDTQVWFAKLTRNGIDVVEYTVPCDAGIARPAKYW